MLNFVEPNYSAIISQITDEQMNSYEIETTDNPSKDILLFQREYLKNKYPKEIDLYFYPSKLNFELTDYNNEYHCVIDDFVINYERQGIGTALWKIMYDYTITFEKIKSVKIKDISGKLSYVDKKENWFKSVSFYIKQAFSRHLPITFAYSGNRIVLTEDKYPELIKTENVVPFVKYFINNTDEANFEITLQ